ncbi:MAG TPA: vWA domain-containing protein [Fibrobacteria bacterium]|nr:vWA domain-containing protein [Fibrobacteria bacterium]
MHIDSIGKRRGAAALALTLALAFLAAEASAQEVQETKETCVLRGRDTVLASGATLKQCLDLDAMHGQTFVVPSNVIGVDSTGFSLCETSRTEGGPADIVYVMDQSGSMQLQYVWISPDERDTVWMHSIGTCRGYSRADWNNHGSITVPRGTTTAQVPRVNPAKDPRLLCTDYWSGDPFYQRDIAMRSAIDLQAAIAPDSRAGYLEFGAGVAGRAPPLPLNTAANIDAVKSSIRIDNGGATNYTGALDRAKQWLKDTTLSPNTNQAIIFVSDGKPSPDSTGYLEVLEETYEPVPGAMPPIYGIFLGVPRPDTLRLAELSRLTKGQFFLIPPDRPDSLRAVVERILKVILKQYQPVHARVSNTAIAGQVAIAGSTDFTRQVGSSWLMHLDRKLALNAGAPNPMDMYTRMRESTSGDTLSKRALFTLSTTGPEERTNRNLVSGPWSVVCADRPPDPNPVRKTYIRDTDNDGAGDKVFFQFTRPLAVLPPSLDTVYWNQVGPAFANKTPPKLSFLPGSGNTVVVADFGASPFGQGLTSIPPGHAPYAVLPDVPDFKGQRPLVEDSIGPILKEAKVNPFDNSKSVANGPLNEDTLVVTLSEPITSNREWKTMLRWGKFIGGACKDFAGSKPLLLSRDAVSADAGMNTFSLYVTTGNGPTPMVGDCVYMNVDGTYRDKPGNIPAMYGKRLEGRQPPRLIEALRGYPPVVGHDAMYRDFVVANQDVRDGTTEGWVSRNGADYEIHWVPPVGWVPGRPLAVRLPATVNDLPVGTEATLKAPLPRNISTVQVISTGGYIADVTLFDNHGRFVKKFKQSFGYFGELNNENRRANRGLASWLVWDLKDSKGAWAGQGVYIWKVVFTFGENVVESHYIRTGMIRDTEWFLNQAAMP